jgi:hypothetical protein
MFKFWKNKAKESTRWDSGYFYDKPNEGGWKDLDKDKLNQILDESRLYLQHIFDSYVNLTQKVSFFLAVIGGTIGFIFTEILLNQEYFKKNLKIEIALVGYFIILNTTFLFLSKYVLPLKELDSVGMPPNGILKKKKMKEDFEHITVNQIEVYQGSIEHNYDIVTRIGQEIKVSFWVVVLYPFFAGGLLLL